MTALAEQVANQIDRAADYIEANGWVQRTAFRDRGGALPAACIAGALVATYATNQTFHALTDHLGLTDGRLGIGSWNDKPGREQWEVLLAMRFAAKRVRAGDIEVMP